MTEEVTKESVEEGAIDIIVNSHTQAMELYDTVIENTQSLMDGNLGVSLAYLMGAILKFTTFEVSAHGHDDVLIEILKAMYDPDDDIWNSITFEEKT